MQQAMRTAITFALLAGLVACRRNVEERRYRDIANEINAIVFRLRPFSTWMLAPGGQTDRDIAIMCRKNDDIVDRLVVFHDIPRRRRGMLMTDVTVTQKQREYYCPVVRRSARDSDQACAEWCRDAWGAFTGIMEEIRVEAEGHGVWIAPLK